MIKVVSPRIHNLGDFANCLPALSGFYKLTGHKMSFSICDRLQRFVGLKELLLAQEMFSDVKFMHEESLPDRYIVIDDQDQEENLGHIPTATFKYANSIRKGYGIQFDIDDEFELNIPKLDIDYMTDKVLVGDRWSSNDAPDVDTRRYSYMIKDSGILNHKDTFYLDYTKDLLYNCSLIKYNPNPFVTTFTGIGILADMMRKDQYIVWGDDLHNWNNKPIEYSFKMHYFMNRNSKLVYIKDFVME